MEERSTVYPHQWFATDLEDPVQTWVGAREDTPHIGASQTIEAGAMENTDRSRLRIRRTDSISTTNKSDADEICQCARVFHGACEALCFVGPSDESIGELEVLLWYPVISAIEELFGFGQVVSWHGSCVTFDLRVGLMLS